MLPSLASGFLIPNLREAGFGTKIKQPPGEGLNAVVSSVPASYGYLETQEKLRDLSANLASGMIDTLKLIE